MKKKYKQPELIKVKFSGRSTIIDPAKHEEVDPLSIASSFETFDDLVTGFIAHLSKSLGMAVELKEQRGENRGGG
ncbi:MAG: hypothetical protein V3U02_05105 [Calditrichia bacterium]